jgi:hypothetical protein
LQNKSSLILREFSILSHRVKADNVLLVERLKRRGFNYRPLFSFGFERFIVRKCSFPSVILFFFKNIDFFLKLGSLLTSISPIRKCLL